MLGVQIRESSTAPSVCSTDDTIRGVLRTLAIKLSRSGTQTITNCPGLGTDKFDFEHISLYPNPTHSVLNIQLDLEAKYRLYDLKGGLFWNGNFDAGTNEINLSSLSTGFYALHIENDQGKVVKKIIKY